MPRVQHISYKQRIHKDPDINKARKEYKHPPTHRVENIFTFPGKSKEVGVKNIRMGGDVSL